MIDMIHVVGWKFNNQHGMSTRDGVLFEFPSGIPGVNYDDNGLPTKADQDAWRAEYDAHIAATQYTANREAAVREQLPETMYLPAMLEQAKADRAGGKTLAPQLEQAVNMYDQIVTDNPEPS